jgi:osmotically-inducible protein OsmY
MITTLMKTDTEIQQDVLAELRWDTRVSAPEIGVEVDQGIVTLTGTVDTYSKKIAAQEAAHRVSGVRDVANDVRVKIAGTRTRTDTEIASAVRRALEWDSVVPDDRILSTVSSGWVELEGVVDTAAQREDAERAILRLAGVLGVTNKIAVAPSPLNPSSVRKAIEAALERQALREAHRIDVRVDEATVTVSGQVRTNAERRAILGAVSHAPGVGRVDDRLAVEPLS